MRYTKLIGLFLLFLLIALLILASASAAYAQTGTIDIAWDAADQAEGYVVRWTPTDGEEPTPVDVDVGNVFAYQLTNLQHCIEYDVRVRSYNPQGYSDWSTPLLAWPRPDISQVQCVAPLGWGVQTRCSVFGASFRPGDVLTQVGGVAGVTLSNAEIVNCNQIDFDIAIGFEASAGMYPITVVTDECYDGACVGNTVFDQLHVITGPPGIVLQIVRTDTVSGP